MSSERERVRRAMGDACRALTMSILCLFAIATPAVAQLPTVHISSWEMANGTGVKFVALPGSEVHDVTPNLTDETPNGQFSYSLDTSDIRWADDCRCYRYYVLTISQNKTGVVSRHKIKAYPSGSFVDQPVGVFLAIAGNGPNSETSQPITLPIASAPGLEPAPLVSIAPLSQPAKVSLGGRSDIQLELRNPSAGQSVQVPSEISVRAEDGHLWKAVTVVEPSAFPLTLGPKAGATVVVRVQPNTWEAIQASFAPTDSDKDHAKLRLKIAYASTQFQHRDGVTEVIIPIRFHPSLMALVMTLFVGVILGQLVSFFAAVGSSPAHVSRNAIAALSSAVVLWLVGIFMVATKSKFVLFSYELDPWQTLPVLLIGIGSGLLGMQAAAQLGFFGKPKGGSAPAATPSTGGGR